MSNIDTRIRDMFNAQRTQAFDKTPDETLSHGGPGGTSGGMTEDWKASVDRRLGELHGDIRALLNRGVLAVVALAAMIGGQYVYFNAKFEAINLRLSVIETQQARDSATMNGKLDLLVDRLPPRKAN